MKEGEATALLAASETFDASRERDTSLGALDDT